MGVTSKKKRFKRKKTKLIFDLVYLMSPLTVMKIAKFISNLKKVVILYAKLMSLRNSI